jgi:hypothetical protein
MKKATRAVAKVSFQAGIRSFFFVADDTGNDLASMTRCQPVTKEQGGRGGDTIRKEGSGTT